MLEFYHQRSSLSDNYWINRVTTFCQSGQSAEEEPPSWGDPGSRGFSMVLCYVSSNNVTTAVLRSEPVYSSDKAGIAERGLKTFSPSAAALDPETGDDGATRPT